MAEEGAKPDGAEAAGTMLHDRDTLQDTTEVGGVRLKQVEVEDSSQKVYESNEEAGETPNSGKKVQDLKEKLKGSLAIPAALAVDEELSNGDLTAAADVSRTAALLQLHEGGVSMPLPAQSAVAHQSAIFLDGDATGLAGDAASETVVSSAVLKQQGAEQLALEASLASYPSYDSLASPRWLDGDMMRPSSEGARPFEGVPRTPVTSPSTLSDDEDNDVALHAAFMTANEDDAVLLKEDFSFPAPHWLTSQQLEAVGDGEWAWDPVEGAGMTAGDESSAFFFNRPQQEDLIKGIDERTVADLAADLAASSAFFARASPERLPSIADGILPESDCLPEQVISEVVALQVGPEDHSGEPVSPRQVARAAELASQCSSDGG